MQVRLLVLGTFIATIAACATQQAPEPAPPPAPAPAPAPRAMEAPAPAAGPEAAKPPSVVNLSATQLFDYNKATLRPDAREIIDDQVLPKLRDLKSVRYINVNGHADRMGGAQYNQRLSEKRADAVRDYLASKGVDTAKIETFGFGKTMPAKSCPDQKNRSALIECLAPNRRVVVEIQGTPK